LRAFIRQPRVPYVLVALIALLPSRQAAGQPFSPQDALKKMKVADGFSVQLAASEPEVRKPVTITFDDRGRMWVIQYLQYPTPNGLKAVKVDQYLRTIYDRVPEPPPQGPKGADRITILEDPDEHGRYRKVKDFHVGLNLASGMALGHGGVFVAQPPYLLFYADKNGDDVPDGDPEVLLTGFGMEDAHAFPNSLQWGPDGWLYGAQGSTVTAKIRGIEFQQGIWRYHPVTKEFELFAEGGGNTWGVDFDRHGNIIAGTNWGGLANLHQVQGAYYVKGFTKHGPLHNPYTFGYFDHIPYTGFKGGHVTCGGIVYQGDAFPEKYRHQYLAANLLSNGIYWHQMERQGSSFTAKWGGELIASEDMSFRPVDMLTGPDGAVYIADWADRRANHVDPVDNWDRTRGRIWKLQATASGGRKPAVPDLTKLPLGKLPSKELVALLSHPNDWQRREARRILSERRDASVIPTLRKLIDDHKEDLALEALWALYVSGGFNDELALKLLDHANEDVRAWTVRLLCDPKKVADPVATRLGRLAREDTSNRVRSQLACSAKRLSAQDGLPIIRALLLRAEDVDDPHLPLLLWWAVEDKAASHREDVLKLFAAAEISRAPLANKHILERLARRWMAGGEPAHLLACARLLGSLQEPKDVDQWIAGVDKALEGRALPSVPGELVKPLAALAESRPNDPTLLRLSVRLGSAPAYAKTLQVLGEERTSTAERLGLIDLLGQIGKPDCVPVFLKLLRDSTDAKLRAACLTALQRFPEPVIGDTVLELYPKLTGDLRNRAQTLLAGRPASALSLLKLVEAKQLEPKEIPLDQLQRMMLYKDEQITKLIEKHWGKVGAQSSGEKQSRIRSLALIVRRGKGDALKGKELYTKHCAVCHQLFNEGNKVGPELTGIDRKNLEVLLVNLVDPSAFIRPEYVAHNVVTKDGRIITGLIAEDNAQALTILDAKNERTVIAKNNIDELVAAAQSLMPEKILDPLSDQEICDLLAWLQSDGPPKAK
jgi:putative membrane-bound dehydrogenase-like protein